MPHRESHVNSSRQFSEEHWKPLLSLESAHNQPKNAKQRRTLNDHTQGLGALRSFLRSPDRPPPPFILGSSFSFLNKLSTSSPCLTEKGMVFSPSLL